MKDGANRENGDKFLRFIASARAQGIYAAHGFVPHFEVSGRLIIEKGWRRDGQRK
jgi:hypothetical protein